MHEGFITKHGLWTEEQARLAADVRRRVEKENVRLVRVAWSDSHGYARAKAITLPAFEEALRNGYNINVATFTLDATGGRVFRSFVRGGGMDLDEMTGSPNLIIVPDPATFRVLPWAPGIGWILCDEYFPDGRPFHFSSRRILRQQVERLADQDLSLRVGLEVEWYMRKVVDDTLTDDHAAQQGQRGIPINTAPIEPGFSYQSESNLDLVQPILSRLAEVYDQLGLPLRSLENEFGPGQLECTFGVQDAMQAADDFLLFRTATRQVCRREGYMASFMCWPAFEGYYASGWHLHQSLADKNTGENLCIPADKSADLSDQGRHFLGGLLEHTLPGTIFSTPTVNGYRRFRPNSLAPDRVTWGPDHRGVLIRTLGGHDDPGTRLENRIGEPAANPYLYIASQIAAGLDGLQQETDPWPSDDDPYAADRPLLPEDLTQAHRLLKEDQFYRTHFGDLFIDYYLALKQAEIDRFRSALAEDGDRHDPARISRWEQNEYFDTF